NQPSQRSTTRCSVYLLSPPSRMGGCGFWAGLGHDQLRSKWTWAPWNSGSSFVQISLKARTCSSSFLKRVLKSVPWCSISSAFQPPPMPSRKRPLLSTSRLATDLAVVRVSRSMMRQMPVPTLRFLVAAAAAMRATNGSWVRLYSSGSGRPPAKGLRRLVGMWVCSGTKSDSNLRASSSRARSSGRMERSVGKMHAPMCMVDSPPERGVRRSLVDHDRIGRRSGGADHPERRPDESALEDLLVDERLGVDVLKVPDAATGLHLGVTGHREIRPLLAGGLRVACGRVAHGQRD